MERYGRGYIFKEFGSSLGDDMRIVSVDVCIQMFSKVKAI
jgi:hypothetical protein